MDMAPPLQHDDAAIVFLETGLPTFLTPFAAVFLAAVFAGALADVFFLPVVAFFISYLLSPEYVVSPQGVCSESVPYTRFYPSARVLVELIVILRAVEYVVSRDESLTGAALPAHERLYQVDIEDERAILRPPFLCLVPPNIPSLQ